MNLGLSTASFYPQINTEDTIEIIAKTGVNILEVFLQTESEYSLEFIKEVVKKIRKYNLDVYSVHGSSSQYEPELFSYYQREIDDSLKTFKKLFEACEMLRAPHYVFHGPRKMTFNENQWDFVIERLEIITNMAKKHGVKITQENVSWCLSGDEKFLEYIKSKNIDNLFFTFDNKQAAKSNVDFLKILDIMAEKIVNAHISDIDKEKMGIFPGQGSFDFQRLFQKLKSIKYNGPLFIEVYGKYLPYDLEKQIGNFRNLHF